jgi:AcrR family transcriptional regulator
MPPRSNTRQRLIDAAIVIMDDVGPARLRLRDVAEAVGIKEPSIYKFFENRDALIAEAGAKRYARGIVEMAERFSHVAKQANTRTEFYAVVQKAVAASTDPERVEDRAGRVVAMAMALSRPEMAKKIRDVQALANKQVGEALAYGAERGWVRTDVPFDVLVFWITAVMSSRVYLELDPKMPHADQWDGFTAQAIMSVLAPPK